MESQEVKIKGWVARDYNGQLAFYPRCPERYGYYWDIDNPNEYMYINNDCFPELRWENEPIKVEVTIKKM